MSGHVIFEPVRPTVLSEAIQFLGDHNKFCSDILVNEDFSNDEMIKFLEKEQNKDVLACSEEEEQHTCFYNHCSSSNEAPLTSEVPNTVENENL